MKKLVLLFSIIFSINIRAQKVDIPKSYKNIKYKKEQIGISHNKQFYPEEIAKPKYTYQKFVNAVISGTDKGIEIDFNDKEINGQINFGLIKTKNIKYPLPVFFNNNVTVKNGKASIPLDRLKGKYDFTKWENTKMLRLGYRFMNKKGNLIYDGKINLTIDNNNNFKLSSTIVAGPFINKLTDEGATISFTTNKAVMAQIMVEGQAFSDIIPTKKHEIKIVDLKPQTSYNYTINYDKWVEHYQFTTAQKKGCRSKFVFAYTSDSRAGKGGGERNIFGVNNYIIKKMVALADYKGASFFQFTGDMINGYSGSNDEQNLQYLNWKHSVENFWHYKPIYIGMGNHEAVQRIFKITDYTGESYFKARMFVDKFPFDKYSAETTFANNFCLPESDLSSEDGSEYDPSSKIDFPSYKENVYDYTYGNLAMIVMNSNYWYASSTKHIPITSGNVHGYIMDNQLKWLKKTIAKYEADKDIDHIIVTFHTPTFPNAGHASDDMWYYGNNEVRPYINGKPVEKGIIERRDELLDIMVNQSEKFVVFLSGDEHNYSRLVVNNNTPIYPENWTGKKIVFKRPYIQITNGSAGAPYYALEQLPWSKSVKKFSTLHALMLFTVNGQHINLEVINPDTFEIIEKINLK